MSISAMIVAVVVVMSQKQKSTSEDRKYNRLVSHLIWKTFRTRKNHANYNIFPI